MDIFSVNYNNDDSALKQQVGIEANKLMQHFHIRVENCHEEWTINAYVTGIKDPTKQYYFVGTSLNGLRHNLTNYDALLVALDDVADKHSWKYHFKTRVHNQLQNKVNEQVYSFLSKWRDKVHKKQMESNWNRAQSSMVKAASLANRLKALANAVHRGDIDHAKVLAERAKNELGY